MRACKVPESRFLCGPLCVRGRETLARRKEIKKQKAKSNILRRARVL